MLNLASCLRLCCQIFICRRVLHLDLFLRLTFFLEGLVLLVVAGAVVVVVIVVVVVVIVVVAVGPTLVLLASIDVESQNNTTTL